MIKILALLVLSAGCINPSALKAYLWMHGGIPQETCDAYPELKDSGILRKLNSGQVEFISYCDDKILMFFDIHKDDLAGIINEQTRKSKKRKSRKIEESIIPGPGEW